MGVRIEALFTSALGLQTPAGHGVADSRTYSAPQAGALLLHGGPCQCAGAGEESEAGRIAVIL